MSYWKKARWGLLALLGIAAHGIPASAAWPEAAPLLEARRSFLHLQEWRFQLDPGRVGDAQGWMLNEWSDSFWPMLKSGQPWEAQGYPDYDGVAWYRSSLSIPAEWKGSDIRLHTDGIDDEFDLFVNGSRIAHFGSPQTGSTWNQSISVELGDALVCGARNVIAIRVNDWGANGGLWRNISLRRVPPLADYASLLPVPILDSHPEWLRLYWEAWGMAWAKVSFGNSANGFVTAYMDEGFNEQIYQWDSSFIALFGRYGARLFPVMATLDNFYLKQLPDGYIQRVYSETTGQELGQPSREEPMVNPPLFAWIEREYLRFSGDTSRLSRVLPVLEKYYRWLKQNVRTPLGRGLYYQTGLGSGMDNTPRGDSAEAAWIDMSLQQALAAKSLSELWSAAGQEHKSAHWRKEFEDLRLTINQLLWDERDGFYYDLQRSGTLTGIKHLGALWALLAEVADPSQAARLVDRLKDPREFFRPRLFPSLSAADPAYSPEGTYWLGGIWAPTNYVTITGLARYGYTDFARYAAMNYLTTLAEVYGSDIPEDRVAPVERDKNYHTLWECYSPERSAPGTRWDGRYFCRQDFVGWTGLGPISLLLEQVIGLQVLAADARIVWQLSETERTGVLNMPFGVDHAVSLVASALMKRQDGSAERSIEVQSSRSFLLQITTPACTLERQLPAGKSAFPLPPGCQQARRSDLER